MSLFQFHSEPVQEGWLDAYGHLNEAYYLVPFSNATWKLQDHFDIGIPYFEKTGCALYTVETHLRYLNEVKGGSVAQIESLILGVDAKKIWFAHKMLVDGNLCATGEFLGLHYNTRENQTAAMSDSVLENLQLAQIQDKPDWVGRRIDLKKK